MEQTSLRGRLQMTLVETAMTQERLDDAASGDSLAFRSERFEHASEFGDGDEVCGSERRRRR